MAVYTLRIGLHNVLTGDTRTVEFQFDPANFTLAKWNNLGIQIKAKIDEMVAASTDPPIL